MSRPTSPTIRTAQSGNSHKLRHFCHLFVCSSVCQTDKATDRQCSLIISSIDYCNAVLHGAPSGTVRKLQRVQNNAARIVHQAPRRSHAHSLLKDLHWLPVEQRSIFKLAVLTIKIRQTSAPAYLRRHIRASCSGTRSLRSSAVPLLDVSFRRTDIGKRSFSCAAPTTWNSLAPSVVNCDTLCI